MRTLVPRLSSKSRRRLLLLNALLLSGHYSSAQQPYGSWQNVEQVQPGAQIVVVTEHHLSCALVQVTADEIICRQAYRGLVRSRVQEVRLGSGRKGAILGVLIGGAAGGALASRSSGGDQGVKIAAGAGLGAAVGGVVGLITGNDHGKIIYRR